MNENRVDELIERAALEYNAPPATPRDEIWSRIREARDADELSRRRRFRPRAVWAAPLLAAAAALVLGIALGRMSREPVMTPMVATAPTAEASTAYGYAAAQTLDEVEVLLTQMRVAGSAEIETVRWARDLLTTTRLLLDSPAVADPQLLTLLEDLELVLAQIASLDGDSGDATRQADELELIRESIDAGSMINRIRATAEPVTAAI